MAGRTVLIKSVLSSTPTYYMQSLPFPSGVSKADKISRNFLWGHDHTTQKWHGVSWNKIVSPKELGGLGIRKTVDANMAFFMNTIWRIWSNANSLLAKVCKGKYFPTSTLWNTCPKPVDSSLWKFMLKASSNIKIHLQWIFGKGESLSCWDDKWCSKFTLRNLFIGPSGRGWSGWTVKDLIIPNPKLWDTAKLQEYLSQVLCDMILAIPLSDYQVLDMPILLDKK